MNPNHNDPAILCVLSPKWITDSNGIGHWNAQHRWSEAEAISISGKSFILLSSNIGNSPDNTIDDLIEMMKKYCLDPYWGTLYGASAGDPSGYWTLDPCEGVRNPHAGLPGEETWIDGPRIFEADGVYSFHGNFFRYCYGFSIYTNHQPTIERLMLAIVENCQMTEDHPEVEALRLKNKRGKAGAVLHAVEVDLTTMRAVEDSKPIVRRTVKSSAPNLSNLLDLFSKPK